MNKILHNFKAFVVIIAIVALLIFLNADGLLLQEQTDEQKDLLRSTQIVSQ